MTTDWSSLKVAELKDECKTRDIPLTGLKLKQQFVDKLTEYEANSQDDTHAEENQANIQLEKPNGTANQDSHAESQTQSPNGEQLAENGDIAERTHGAIEEMDKDEVPAQTEQESKPIETEEVSLEALQHDDRLGEEAREERVSESIPLAVQTDKNLPADRPATLKVEDSQASNADADAQADDDVPMADTEQEAQDIKDNDIMIPQAEQLDVGTTDVAQRPNGLISESEILEDNEAAAKLKRELEESKPEEMEIVDNVRTSSSPKRPDVEGEDLRKRKRRSDSPDPEAEVVQKKAKSSEGQAVITKATKSTSGSSSPGPKIEPANLTKAPDTNISRQDKESSPDNDSIEPALHAATRSLYLSNFKRPLNIQALRTHITTIAKDDSDENPIDFFNINNIRSHAFVTFKTTKAAARVRRVMHNSRFPDDPIRDPLFVDFIPDDKAEEWVQQETSGSRGSRNSNAKMEVVYKSGSDGMEATFEDTSIKRRESFQPRESISTGTRATVTSGVHPDRVGIVPEQQSPAQQQEERGMGFKDLDDLFQSTKAKPKLYFKLPPQKVIDQRLDMIRDLYSDRGAPGAPNMKRYTFDGDGRQQWVDAGPEYGKGKVGMDRLRGTGGRGRGGGGGFRGRGRGHGGDSYHGRGRW